MTLKHLVITLGIVPLLALGSWRFWHRMPPIPEVAVVQAQQGDLLAAVTATGTIQPRRTVDIKYDTVSLITGLFVKEGDRVTANQPVATMDLGLLEPAVAQARQTLQKDQANLLLAQASLRRAEALAAAQVMAPADLDSARANHEALSHLAEADEAAVAQVEEQIRRATLRSPIKGVVIALYVHEGEMLGSATAVADLGPNAAISKPTNTLMTVAEDGDLEIDADVNAVDMGGVLTGQAAKFTIDAFQPAIFTGTVRNVALQPTIMNSVTTYRVVISILHPDHRFRIGMPPSVMLFRAVAKNAMLVPLTALLRENNSLSVIVFNRENLWATTSMHNGTSGERISSGALVAQKELVQFIGETSSAVAVKGNIRSGEWILLDASSRGAHTDTINPIEAAFKPNPDPSDLQFERAARSSDQQVSAIPGPKPKGFLQELFNP